MQSRGLVYKSALVPLVHTKGHCIAAGMTYSGRMAVYIHGIGTAVPTQAYTQDYALAFMREHVATTRRAAITLQRIYRHSGIHKRHSVIEELAPGAPSGPFFDADEARLLNPSTQVRNAIYAEVSAPLWTMAATRAMQQASVKPADITHVVTASCTGFFAPGPETHLVKALNLSPRTQAFHLGFMGCYAAFPALRLAQMIAAADAQATVLIVCLELCTLHLQFTEDTDALLSASLFADGAGAAIVRAAPPPANRPAFRVQALSTARTPIGEEDMRWTIGDTGFDMTLSSRVPVLIERYLREVLAPYAISDGVYPDWDIWAVHPGGRAILDAVQSAGVVPDAALAASRDTLREFGNMSSATIWFVLQRIMQQVEDPGSVIAMAFGPGLTVETGVLEWMPARAPADVREQHHADLVAST